jgi:acyl dehydratase
MPTSSPQVLDATPNLPLLFGKAVATGFTRRGGDRLPSTVYEQAGVTVHAERLARYNRVCEFRLTDELPITYPHILAFPLQVKLMTDRDFPFPLIGSVHLANRISQTRPLRLGEPLVLRVRADNLREHARGRQFDLISEAAVQGEVVWRDVSTYLRRGKGTGSGPKEDRPQQDRPQPPTPNVVWPVPGDIGRRYAEVSGDRNPIHLHPLTAKAFGFPKAIAHGMWTKARCLAALERDLPPAYMVDVRFKLPVLLPAKIGFVTRDDGREFELFDARGGKPHLEGTITPA